MSSLAQMEDDLTVSTVMKKSVWSLTHQLGVPSLLLKLRSPFHAMAIYFVTDRDGEMPIWACSVCTIQEVMIAPSCIHAQLLKNCIIEVAKVLGCSAQHLSCSMSQSAAFNHISDLPSTCFYGSKRKHELAVHRDELRSRVSPINSSGRIRIIKRLSSARGWRCLNRSCSGLSSSCIHIRSVEAHIEKGLTHCFANIFDLVGDSQDSSDIPMADKSDIETNSIIIEIPRYSSPLIPSRMSFDVDFNVKRNSRNGTCTLLKASPTCHCGCCLSDMGSTFVEKCQLRVESTRCFVEYDQEVWKCRNGHIVTPEQDSRTREGLVWISRDTAYTEVFLFDLLLHITVGGATLSSQTDLRSQVLHLQTEYMNPSRKPRSHQSVRKALNIYTMAIVEKIPAWVFRCSKGGEFSSGEAYYDKMSFDGQQVGFNITKDARYDFYGKPSTPWRRPVERNPKASSLTQLIQSRALRMIVLDALRVREIPPGSNSVHSICRAMMSLSFRSKDSVRAAVAAIKMFDPEWSIWVPAGTPSVDDGEYECYMRTWKAECHAHPISYITNNTTPSPTDFDRALTIMEIFRNVLDCRKPAHVIAVLVNELRGELKNHIPSQDKEFIAIYAEQSNSNLHSWLCAMSQLDSWPLVMPDMMTRQIQEELTPGIVEHIGSLKHPIRPPVSWQEESNYTLIPTSLTMFSCVRKLQNWTCPRDDQTSVLMLFMALLNEPVAVWLRDGRFSAVMAGIEVLEMAETHCEDPNVFAYYSNALQRTYEIGLLFEGLVGVIGANISAASDMFAAVREVLALLPKRQAEYEASMQEISLQESASAKEFICSPKEFDDMLYRTGAIERESNDMGSSSTDGKIEPDSTDMRALYDKIAKLQSNDFMETGVWAPDFPVRRPSPSSSMWGADASHAEVSCSKDFSTHKAFSPGTFGAYCLCAHPKTLMVTFLKRPEGCRMPLNTIVERCAKLSRYVIYDFACGTQTATACLSAEITKRTRFVIDPFHFPGHKTCSLAMHEASFMDLRGCNAESQEQRNSSIKNMERTLRATKDVQFMHLVIVAHAYLNLKAMFLDHQDETRHNQTTEGSGSTSWLNWIREEFESNQ